MDYYPQPRPALYGTLAEDVSPRTQTSPVRAEPPRWPPAPPTSAFDDGSDDNRWWPSDPPAQSRRLDDAPSRFVLAGLYVFAFAYALCIALIVPQAFADLSLVSRIFLIFQVVATPWAVPCFLALRKQAYLVALGISLSQLLLGFFSPVWLWPGLAVGLIGCIYLLRPSMIMSSRFCLLWPGRFRVERFTNSTYAAARNRGRKPPSDKVNLMRKVHSAMPDDWKTKFN